MSDTTTTEKPVKVEETEDGGAMAFVPLDQLEKDGGDRRVGRDPADEDDEAGDEGATSGSAQQGNQKGRKRRERQRQAKEYREQQIDQLTGLVSNQQRMLAALARNQQENSLKTLESEAGQAKAAYAEAQRRHADGITRGDGVAVNEALQVMKNSENYYNHIVVQAQQIQQGLQQMPTHEQIAASGQPQGQGNGSAQPPPLSRKAEEFKQQFLDEHPWVDLDKRSPETTAILQIDAQVRQEGFDWGTKDYWDELKERIQETFPHKYGSGRKMPTNDARFNNRPPHGGAGDRGGDVGDGKVRLTPDMVRNMEAANIPLRGGGPEMDKRRNKIIKYWRENAS